MSAPQQQQQPPPPTAGKSSWPDLVGVMATEAAMTIAHDRPDVAVEVHPPGSTKIPGLFNAARVRIFIDGSGLVSEIPAIG